jgi:NAD+ synthase (glutamine-hydrolysing)
MPSRYTSKESEQDAKQSAKNLGVHLETLNLETCFSSFLETLAPTFAGQKTDVTEENLQARCRGVLLMALANKQGGIVLITGNRSEFAVGYTTLYGDMAGGFAVLMDVPKTKVYQLAHYRNHLSPIIPEGSFTRPPSAELAPKQKDEDSLAPYPLLDKILDLYLTQEKSPQDLVALGFNKELVAKIVQLILRNEYKRRQAPVGVRLNEKSFGKDRRYPLTSGFKG